MSRREYKVSLECANCGIGVKWFPATKTWLHTDTLTAFCSSSQGTYKFVPADATPKVTPIDSPAHAPTKNQRDAKPAR